MSEAKEVVIVSSDEVAGRRTSSPSITMSEGPPPYHGIGYGAIKQFRLDDSRSKWLKSSPELEVSFNYQGRFTAGLGGGDGLFTLSENYSAEPLRATNNSRNRLKFNFWPRIDEHGQLRVVLRYSRTLYRDSTADDLVKTAVGHLRALLSPTAMR